MPSLRRRVLRAGYGGGTGGAYPVRLKSMTLRLTGQKCGKMGEKEGLK